MANLPSVTGSTKHLPPDHEPADHEPADHEPATARSVVGIRELRADVAALVRRAGAGEHVVVSVAGRPVAHLGPLTAGDGHTCIEDLIASGRVTAPRRTGTYSPSDPVPMWQGSRIDRLLHEIR